MNRVGMESKTEKGSRWRTLAVSSIFFVSVFLSLYCYLARLTVTPPEQEPKTKPKSEPHLHVVEGSVKEQGTLYESLVQKKIPIRWITDMEGELVRFLFEKSPTEVYEIEKGTQGYVTKQKEVSLERYLVKVEGEIRSSLYEAMDAAGEKDSLTLSFAEILAWEIDFYQDLQRGDRFKVLVEKLYKRDQFVQYGTIRGVEYKQGEKIIRGIRFREDFYSGDGISLRKAFLKAPLRFDRISSRFSGARRHPILGGMRPHYGVDYAAPAGTPVWAVADGTVLSVGRNGGFGKQVIVRHMNGYKTCYGHLSRYGPGIRKGVRVTQKQIIGYVGSTGLSTGPHLDYRLTKGSRFRNPLKEVFPTGDPIGEGDLEAFQKMKDEILILMSDTAPYRSRLDNITNEDLSKRS
jgi:murein DD-endopeptidase MepM/ murein hydrolase activator NlpD